jgi:hypothetical protein
MIKDMNNNHDVIIRCGNMTPNSYCGVYIKVGIWKRILCLILGHKNNNNNESLSFIVNIPNNHGESTMKFTGCARCGVYQDVTIFKYTQLSKDEQMIKDIIL